MTPRVPSARFVFAASPSGLYTDRFTAVSMECREWLGNRAGRLLFIGHMPYSDERSLVLSKGFGEDIFDS